MARWILLPIAIGLVGWVLFEFIHDDYRPPKEPTDAYDIEAKRVAHAIKLPGLHSGGELLPLVARL